MNWRDIPSWRQVTLLAAAITVLVALLIISIS
jgi:hypothetical protein